MTTQHNTIPIHQHGLKNSTIDILQIIEGDPNNYINIYSNGMPLQQSSSCCHQFRPIIWFNIWCVSTPKNFMADIGVIMADTGLQELIQLVYSGGAYAKTIRVQLLAYRGNK